MNLTSRHVKFAEAIARSCESALADRSARLGGKFVPRAGKRGSPRGGRPMENLLLKAIAWRTSSRQ